MYYEILDITEDDYGCEEIPKDGEVMCNVLIADENSNEKWVKIADSYLLKNGLNTGDFLTSEEIGL